MRHAVKEILRNLGFSKLFGDWRTKRIEQVTSWFVHEGNLSQRAKFPDFSPRRFPKWRLARTRHFLPSAILRSYRQGWEVGCNGPLHPRSFISLLLLLSLRCLSSISWNWFKGLLWSNFRYPFFYIFVHKVFPGYLAKLQSITKYRTQVFWTFISVNRRPPLIYLVVQFLVENWSKWRHILKNTARIEIIYNNNKCGKLHE